MTVPEVNNDDLGIEYFDDVLKAQGQPTEGEEKGLLGKAAEVGMFGPLATEEGRRHLTRTGARIGETLMGLPGDVVELFNSIAIGIPEYFAGEELPRWRQMVEGPSVGQPLGLKLPTSREIREEISQPLAGEYLEPQSGYERFADEIAQDFAALAVPVKGKVPFARALGSSVIANSGAEVAKAFGGDEAAAATKMGLLLTTSLAGHKGGGVKQHIRNLYKDMEATIPEGAEISAKSLSSKLDKIESVLRKGDPLDASKAPAFQKIKAIRDKINGGMIPVDELIELTKGTNESIFGLGELKRSQNQLYKIREALHDTTKEYGAVNREMLEKWQAANEAYAATETSRRIGKWVRRNVKPKDYLYAAGVLGMEGSVAGAPATAATLAGGGGLAATAYSAEVMKRIAQSPALRRYYTNVITGALNENKASFTRAMNQLNKGLEKSFQEEPYETVEF